ncbi:MAG: hypothetical protein ACFB9M_17985 [Myxococcota bacterium]
MERIVQAGEHANTYRQDVAYLLALISTWSYSEPETLGKVLRRPSVGGPDRLLRLEQHSVRNPALPVDVNCYVITFDGGDQPPLNVVCFRGTELTNIIDLLTDALVEPHPWPGGSGEEEWVHRGFFLSLDVLWPELRDVMSELRGPLYMTGHSLGGAVSVLAARRFFDDRVFGPTLLGIYTFGQPMVGGRAFARSWPGAPLHRHVYDQDVVVRLPPLLSDSDTNTYHHFGRTWFPARRDGAPVVWSELRPETDAETIKDINTACEGFDILPALLTLITTRAPSLPTEMLEFVAQLPTVNRWIGRAPLRLLRGERVIPKARFSLNDHIPTYYVDVSRNSLV